jgi:hypothetical protein
MRVYIILENAVGIKEKLILFLWRIEKERIRQRKVIPQSAFALGGSLRMNCLNYHHKIPLLLGLRWSIYSIFYSSITYGFIERVIIIIILLRFLNAHTLFAY